MYRGGCILAIPTATPAFYALFKGSYATGTGSWVSIRCRLRSHTGHTTLASGATLDITFAQISGLASVSTSIGFYMPNENTAFSSTIYVASSGAVSY